MTTPVALIFTRWIAEKLARQVAESGVQRVARNLRKQGYPLEIALALLVGRTA